MILAEMTALMSRVGLRKPELMCDRSVALFIQECIEEAKQPQAQSPPGLTNKQQR